MLILASISMAVPGTSVRLIILGKESDRLGKIPIISLEADSYSKLIRMLINTRKSMNGLFFTSLGNLKAVQKILMEFVLFPIGLMSILTFITRLKCGPSLIRINNRKSHRFEILS